jgi:hypothetical protein
MLGIEPLAILGGTVNARFGHFSSSPPATLLELLTSGNGVMHFSIFWYLFQCNDTKKNGKIN